MRRMIGLAALALAGTAPASPARAEFVRFEQLQGLCAGQAADAAEFRTEAAHMLLRDIYRARCRMYLLGLADGLFARWDVGPPALACLRTERPEAEVADALIEAVLSRTAPPAGGVGEIVREVLRDRYGCG